MKQNRMDSHQWDSSLDPELVPLFLHLQWARSRSMDAMRPLLSKHGVSPAEFDVLATLRNAPAPHEMTPSRIQQEMVITSGGLTKVMLQLEGRGLVTRLPSKDDRRVKPIRLTVIGRQLVEMAMTEMLADMGAWIRSALGGAEIAQLTALLCRLVEAPGQGGPSS